MALTREQELRRVAFDMAIRSSARMAKRPSTVEQVLAEADTFYEYLTKK